MIGPCAQIGPNNELVDVDFAGLIRRLLLFETYILSSTCLRELPAIVAALGYEQLLELLSSKAIKIHCDALMIGQTGQLELSDSRIAKGILPLGSYSFSVLKIPEAGTRPALSSPQSKSDMAPRKIHDYDDYVHKCLQELHKSPSLSLKQVIKLKQKVVEALVPNPPERGIDSVRQLNTDLRAKSPIVHRMLQEALKRYHGISVPQTALDVHIEEIAEADFRVETNLDDLGLDGLASHKVVEHALLAVGGLNQRIEEMKAYNAISGCLSDECPLFMDKLGFLLARYNPGGEEESFQKVLEIRGLPEFLPRIDKVDIARLLAIRDCAEAREFRFWLSTLDAPTDEEIRDRVGGFVAKAGDFMQSNSGRTARFVTTLGVGLLGPIQGAVAGVIDEFLIDRIMPKSGVWTFINKLYPSIFRPRD